MRRRDLIRGATATAALGLLGTGTASACCCGQGGQHCPCENMCPYCAECDDGDGDGGTELR